MCPLVLIPSKIDAAHRAACGLGVVEVSISIAAPAAGLRSPLRQNYPSWCPPEGAKETVRSTSAWPDVYFFVQRPWRLLFSDKPMSHKDINRFRGRSLWPFRFPPSFLFFFFSFPLLSGPFFPSPGRGVCLSNWINKPKKKTHFRNVGIADKQMG